MKQSSWCLMLGKERVFNVRQLREHFDTDIITGYLLGGVLESWLLDAGELEIFSRVKSVDRSGDIGGQLEFIFGVRPEIRDTAPENVKKALAARAAQNPENKALADKTAPCSFTASSLRSSFGAGSFRKSGSGVLRSGALSVSSFQTGSYRVGSFRRGETGANLLRTGSYKKGSFKAGSGLFNLRTGFIRLSSMHAGAFRSVGSFRLVSFGKAGSYSFGSGSRFSRLFISGSGRGGSGGSFSRRLRGSFGGVSGSGGSFRYYAGDVEITGEEYRRTLINLSSCPLNEYGYGIHLI